jgi:hypothetical protein
LQVFGEIFLIVIPTKEESGLIPSGASLIKYTPSSLLRRDDNTANLIKEHKKTDLDYQSQFFRVIRLPLTVYREPKINANHSLLHQDIYFGRKRSIYRPRVHLV